MTSPDSIRYDVWLEEALRGVVKRALEHTRDHGLPGEHHYYITFETGAPGVIMPDHLRALHPDEMTVVLQHQYEYLDVTGEGFSVTLRFSGRPARLDIPFSALTAFADPSVHFGLQLKMAPEGGEDDLDDLDDDDMIDDLDDILANDGDDAIEAGQAAAGPSGSAEVIALDAFRKK